MSLEQQDASLKPADTKAAERRLGRLSSAIPACANAMRELALDKSGKVAAEEAATPESR